VRCQKHTKYQRQKKKSPEKENQNTGGIWWKNVLDSNPPENIGCPGLGVRLNWRKGRMIYGVNQKAKG
jgi:hypothetical protein